MSGAIRPIGRNQCQWHMALLCVKHPQRAQVHQSWRRRMSASICSITSAQSLNTSRNTDNERLSICNRPQCQSGSIKKRIKARLGLLKRAQDKMKVYSKHNTRLFPVYAKCHVTPKSVNTVVWDKLGYSYRSRVQLSVSLFFLGLGMFFCQI